MAINTLLFDLDGTLVDTASDLAYALNSLLSENDIEEKSYEDIRPLVSLGGRALIKFGFNCDESHPNFTSWHQRILEIYTRNIDKHSKVFDGINETIKTLKDKQMNWGIVTNKPENLTYLLLDKLNINPDVIVCGDTLKHQKPHPAPLLYACAQLATKPELCLFIGDDKNDMLAGKNSGIKTVAAAYGYGKVEQNWNYDFLIKNPKDILELI